MGDPVWASQLDANTYGFFSFSSLMQFLQVSLVFREFHQFQWFFYLP
jgi:hypothetical protein